MFSPGTFKQFMKLLDASLITNELTESKRQLEHEGFGKDPMSNIKRQPHLSTKSRFSFLLDTFPLQHSLLIPNLPDKLLSKPPLSAHLNQTATFYTLIKTQDPVDMKAAKGS
jgi:hypothetical protein